MEWVNCNLNLRYTVRYNVQVVYQVEVTVPKTFRLNGKRDTKWHQAFFIGERNINVINKIYIGIYTKLMGSGRDNVSFS